MDNVQNLHASNPPQADHYDRIIDDYDRHYYDKFSVEYRERFILGPLLRGIDLHGKRVADLACGSGNTSVSLISRFPDIEITGFDISPEACRRYRQSVGRDCTELDLTRGYAPAANFDAAIIMGGLHHCAANLPAALAAIRMMLRPGGLLMMFEPNSNYVLEFGRRLWYRLDPYFDSKSEAALSHDALLQQANGGFVPRSLAYLGGPAFYLVYNSLVFRLPHGIKAAIASPLLGFEATYNRLPGRWLFSSFVAQWVRAD